MIFDLIINTKNNKETIKAGAMKCRHPGEAFDSPAGVTLAAEGVS